MTLDEFRGTLIERLRACRDTAAVRDLLAEVNLVLINSQINALTQDRFWETLEEELDVLGEDAKLQNDPGPAAVLGAVVAAARARIARYRRREEGESPPIGEPK